MTGRNIKWLKEELAAWQTDGLVTAETAAKIAARYSADNEQTRSRSLLLIVFGIIGALFIGGGVILLIGHNWSELGRPVRAVLALVPMLAGHYVCWQALSKARGTGWREGGATFLALAVGAAIALVGQTYNLGGTVSAFLLAWMVLLLPVIFIMDSRAVLALYVIGVTGWGVNVRVAEQNPYWAWLLLVPVALQLWRLWPERQRGGHPFVYAVFGICLPICIVISLQERFLEHTAVYIIAILGAIYVLIDRAEDEVISFWRQPINRLGTLTLVMMALAMTLPHVWHEVGHSSVLSFSGAADWPLDASIFITLIIILAVLLARSFRIGAWLEVYYAAFAILLVVLGLLDEDGIGALLFHGYFFGLGLFIILTGWRRLQVGRVNAGMLVMAIWIGSIFFNTHMEFMLRGILFILLGCGFLTANVLLAKRRKTVRAAPVTEVTP